MTLRPQRHSLTRGRLALFQFANGKNLHDISGVRNPQSSAQKHRAFVQTQARCSSSSPTRRFLREKADSAFARGALIE
jgi:hypothetical protein